MRPLRAFTLIEMLISLAIGGVICSTAFVAVRVASQTVSTAARLSTENELLRIGVNAALNELDDWRYYDEPTAPGQSPSDVQPLRAPEHPFNRLTGGSAQTEDFNFDYNPARDPADPNGYEKWWRREARLWFTSDPNGAVGGDGDHGLGWYGLFGWVDYPDNTLDDGTLLTGAEKRWRHRLCKLMAENLGYFALVDYAPASLLYHYYETPNNSAGEFMNESAGGIGSIVTVGYGDGKPKDFISLTAGSYITMTVPQRNAAPYDAANINRATFLAWHLGYNDGGRPAEDWGIDDGYGPCAGRLPLLAVGPAAWPDLRVSIRHFAANARQVHSATVIARSPITSQTLKLYLSYTGTTLRGARRTRGLDGSWP